MRTTRIVERIDGLRGRLVFRFLGLVAAGMTLAASAACPSPMAADGAKSVIAFVMFRAGAAIAGFTTRYWLSPECTFGDFIQAVEGSDAEAGWPPDRCRDGGIPPRTAIGHCRGSQNSARVNPC